MMNSYPNDSYHRVVNEKNDTTNAVVNDGCSETIVLYDSVIGLQLAVPQFEAFVTAIVLGLVILITIVGNVLVIISVFNYRPLRTAQNFFIVSLAGADLTVAVLVLPLNVVYYLKGKWIFGIIVCKLWLTCDVLCCTASILNLCAIAFDRFCAITDPINYASKRTVRRVNMMIAFMWLLSLAISSPPLIGWNDWPDVFDETTPCKLTSKKGYVIYSASGSFFIPLAVMMWLYLQIFIATRRRLRERAKASKINAFKIGVMEKPPLSEVDNSPNENNNNNNNNNNRSISGVVSVGGETDNLAMTGSIKGKNNKKYKRRFIGKTKRKDKHEDSYQCSLLAVPLNNDESFSDVQSISPGRGATSSNNSNESTTTPPSAMANLDQLQQQQQQQKNGKPKNHNNSSIKVSLFRYGSESVRSSNGNRSATHPVVTTTPVTTPGNVVAAGSNKKCVFVHQFIEEKQRISLSKERKAARTLGIIMGVFVVCWLPFFLMYVVLPFCELCCLSVKIINFITWLGYINSALNPFIYTIFNMDFRKAFKKILHLK